jgi:hypothetical protein
MQKKLIFAMAIFGILFAGCSNDVKPSKNSESPQITAKDNLVTPVVEETASTTATANKEIVTPNTFIMERDSEDNDRYIGIPTTFQSKEVQRVMSKVDAQGIQCLREKLKEHFNKEPNAIDEREFSEIHIIDAKVGKIAKSDEDMVIVAKYRFKPYLSHPNTVAIVCLVKSGTYSVGYSDAGDLFDYSLQDIDSDGVDEVFVKREYNYKGIEHGLKVLKYKQDKFSTIFDSGFSDSPYHSRYTSDFTYSTVQNPSNKPLKDILFNIETTDNGEGPARDNPKIDKAFPLKDTVKFTFNGEYYVPNKNVNGYVNFTFMKK